MTNANEELIGFMGQFKTFLKNVNNEWSRKTMTGMNYTQFKLLFTLHTSDSLKVSELAEILGLTSGAITGIADKLVAEGLISRERANDDRRVVYIELTAKGKDMVDDILESQKETFSSFFNVLPEEDIQHLRRIFAQLLANMDNK
ncbi:MarR family winged helix-turn-helix transcriptional regulator [Paenibacillus sp. JDR-2]|uniref:MarR family winged helix-turn-helix transcriptional regulator n=1 Tax=Paenibacillus sp. (strain JDR-2) TaxID=324057 RepID=UPI000166AF10|nr:MarR family transcriptional regulator [Paenibacillus sp. JDR-2]ACS99536.1 transcriptional regulator, MarR family [Paenibacillus sp. JDR-2]